MRVDLAARNATSGVLKDRQEGLAVGLIRRILARDPPHVVFGLDRKRRLVKVVLHRPAQINRLGALYSSCRSRRVCRPFTRTAAYAWRSVPRPVVPARGPWTASTVRVSGRLPTLF